VLLQAKRSIHDAKKSVEAEERAKEAAAAAQRASEGAATAAAAATASAEKAAQIVANAQAKLNGPIEELAASAALLESAEEAEQAAAAAVDATKAEPEASPTVHVTELNERDAKRLYMFWEAIEKSYVRGAKLAFSGLRRLRQALEKRMADSHEIFSSHLLRPDERQVEVTKFQMQFNSIDLDMRTLPEVKAELALQVWSNSLLTDLGKSTILHKSGLLHAFTYDITVY
jgi:hypothetical protein